MLESEICLLSFQMLSNCCRKGADIIVQVFVLWAKIQSPAGAVVFFFWTVGIKFGKRRK